MGKIIAIVLVLLAASGCSSVTKIPEPYGGSKADGTVLLSYKFDTAIWRPFDVDYVTANTKARKRCQGWGYKDAILFKTQTSECARYGGLIFSTCEQESVSLTYQCTN